MQGLQPRMAATAAPTLWKGSRQPARFPEQQGFSLASGSAGPRPHAPMHGTAPLLHRCSATLHRPDAPGPAHPQEHAHHHTHHHHSRRHHSPTPTPSAPLGFGFSAGGLLFPYYVGITCCLRDELKILSHDVPVAGASAGSLIAATCKSGISEGDLVDATLRLARDCREGGTRFRLRSVLQRTLMEMLPDDIHERCSGVVHVAVTHVWPRLRPALVSHFTSKAQVIETLLVSCHIPWYFDGSLVTRYQEGLAFDGGLTNFIPVPPNCHGAVRVACFPASKLKLFQGIGLSPDTFESWDYDMNQMIQWALAPASEEMLLFLVEKGKRDARAWAARAGHATGAPPVAAAAPTPTVLLP